MRAIIINDDSGETGVVIPAQAGIQALSPRRRGTINKEIVMNDLIKLDAVVSSLLYSFLGIAIFWVTFIVIDKLTPYQLWKELVEEKNTALAIVVSGMALGICVIIAAAIH